MSHETVVASTASPFDAKPESAHVPPPSAASPATYSGSGGGSPDVFAGLYDHGVDVSLDKGDLTAAFKRKDVQKKRGTELGVTVGADGVEAKGKLSRGDNGVSVGGGVRSTYGKPQLMPDGRWSVTYDTTLEGSLGGNTKRVSAGVSGSRASGGTRMFASRAEAEAFEKGDHAATSNDPMDLAIGESLASSQSAKGKLGVAQGIGAGVSAGGTRGETVTRLDERTVEVTVASGREVGGTLSAGAGPVSAGGGVESGTAEERRYRFDVTTKEGRAALTACRAVGWAPAKYLAGTADSLSAGSKRAVDFGVAGVSTGGKTTVRHDSERGDTYTGTRTKGASVVGLGAHSAVASLVSGPDGTDLTSSVKSDDGSSSMAELAEATGTRARGMPGGGPVASSGSWSVESHLSDEQLARFTRALTTNGDVALAPLAGLSGHGRELREKLRAAKGPGEQRKAMAELVAGAGGKGSSWVRQLAGATDYDVKLENDPVFRGAAGRAELEREVAQAREHVDPKALTERIGALYRRCAAIQDPKRYTDLPMEVRLHEIRKTYGTIEELTRLRDAALGR